jgi:hypothetical protein
LQDVSQRPPPVAGMLAPGKPIMPRAHIPSDSLLTGTGFSRNWQALHAALTADFRGKVAVLREAALLIRNALAALFCDFAPLLLAHGRKATSFFTFFFFFTHVTLYFRFV